jgi:hypothetical protein
MSFPTCSQFREKSLTVQAALALACAELDISETDQARGKRRDPHGSAREIWSGQYRSTEDLCSVSISNGEVKLCLHNSLPERPSGKASRLRPTQL